MDGYLLTPRSGILYSGVLLQVSGLFQRVCFTGSVPELLADVFGILALRLMAYSTGNAVSPDGFDPLPDRPISKCFQARLDPTATVVSADNNVLDLEVVNGILQNSLNIRVVRDNPVGDIAVDKYLARLDTGNETDWNPGIGAANPQVCRCMHTGNILEVTRVCFAQSGGPLAVVFEQLVDTGHLGFRVGGVSCDGG